MYYNNLGFSIYIIYIQMYIAINENILLSSLWKVWGRSWICFLCYDQPTTIAVRILSPSDFQITLYTLSHALTIRHNQHIQHKSNFTQRRHQKHIMHIDNQNIYAIYYIGQIGFSEQHDTLHHHQKPSRSSANSPL